MRSFSRVLFSIAIVSFHALCALAQGDACSHGTAAIDVEALAYTYALGDSLGLEQALGALMEDPAYLASCSGGYGETAELVLEIAVRHMSMSGRPDRAISIINTFEPFLDEEPRLRWIAIRGQIERNGRWPTQNTPWDETFMVEPFPLGDTNSLYMRMRCGGHEREYGFVKGDGESKDSYLGVRGMIYTLGLRSITRLVGYGWPYAVAIEQGKAFYDIEDAAEVLCRSL